MYPINFSGTSYTAADFTTSGYEAKIKKFIEDCASFLSGVQYASEVSGHHCAFFSGSYDPTITSSVFNGAIGGNRIGVGMQVVLVSLNSEKLGYGVVTAATLVSDVDGVQVKNFTVQVTHRYNPTSGSPVSGWLILPGPVPSVVTDSILSKPQGGSGASTSSGLALALGTSLPSLNKATYFEDFEAISKGTDPSSYLASLADGLLPSNIYAPCKGSATVNFSCPIQHIARMDGNTVGVANLQVRESGDIACLLSSNSLISYPMRDSVFTARFIVCTDNRYSSSEDFSLFAGLLDFGSVTPNIPNLLVNSGYPTGLLLDRTNSGTLRARREFNGSSANYDLVHRLQNFTWYKLSIINASNTFFIEIKNETTGETFPSTSLGSTIFTDSENLCTPYIKLAKTSGSSGVNVLVDYFHWKLPGERNGLPD